MSKAKDLIDVLYNHLKGKIFVDGKPVPVFKPGQKKKPSKELMSEAKKRKQ